MNKLDQEVGTATAASLSERNNTLTELQSKATQIDQTVIEQLSKQAKSPESLQPLDDQRRRLVAEILFVNKRVTEKAKAVRSYLSFEMKKMRTGMLAMSGYGQQHQLQQGRIVNRSF